MKKFTRFEKTRIIAARALQLASGAKPLIETDVDDVEKIAEIEFEKGLLPIDVKRPMPKKE